MRKIRQCQPWADIQPRSRSTKAASTPVPEIIEELADSIVVLREGEILAHDTAEGLRRLVQSGGMLDEVIARLIHPKTLDNLARYFEEST